MIWPNVSKGTSVLFILLFLLFILVLKGKINLQLNSRIRPSIKLIQFYQGRVTDGCFIQDSGKFCCQAMLRPNPITGHKWSLRGSGIWFCAHSDLFSHTGHHTTTSHRLEPGVEWIVGWDAKLVSWWDPSTQWGIGSVTSCYVMTWFAVCYWK